MGITSTIPAMSASATYTRNSVTSLSKAAT
jgi:hypothetical protein